MPKKPVPFKIELTGQAAGPIEDNLSLLLEVMRTIAKDFKITIDYPAMIYLDDLEEPNGNPPLPHPHN